MKNNSLKFQFLLLIMILIFNSGCIKNNPPENNIDEENKILRDDSISYIANIDTANIKHADIIAEDEINTKQKEIKPINPAKFTEGIYLTAYTIATDKVYTILDSAEAAGINTVVFDLKNMNGNIFFSMPQKDSLMRKKVKPIIDIPAIVKTLHNRNMRAVARVVMFHDQIWAQADSTVRPSLPDGSQWTESDRRGPCWLDSSNRIVQQSLLEIISRVAKQGVDEIQLDYIRFPTQGNVSSARFDFHKEDRENALTDSNYVFRQKEDIITEFVEKAKSVCNKYNVKLTADVFAIVAWQRRIDISYTGQNISRMSAHLDAIHPMIYSSHFADNFGFRQDVHNEPYHLLYKGTKLSQRYSKQNCKIIPYIQANSWRVNYTYEYVIAQIKAIEDLGADGYLLWNASNNYYKTLNWIKKYKANQ